MSWNSRENCGEDFVGMAGGEGVTCVMWRYLSRHSETQNSVFWLTGYTKKSPKYLLEVGEGKGRYTANHLNLHMVPRGGNALWWIALSVLPKYSTLFCSW